MVPGLRVPGRSVCVGRGEMFVVGCGLLYMSLSILLFVSESICLQAQQVWCVAAPMSLPELWWRPSGCSNGPRMLWAPGLPGASFAIQLAGYKLNREPRTSPWVLLLHLH